MHPSKEPYVPLRRDPSPISLGSPPITRPSSSPIRPSSTLLFSASTVFLLVIVAVQAIFLSRTDRLSSDGLILGRTIVRQVGLPTRFMSPNETEAAAAWDAIESGHGDVAVDPRWAASRGLPPSFLHPLDSTRMVYVVEAYHAIHCLKVLRNHYMALLSSSPARMSLASTAPVGTTTTALSWDLDHDMHCFDELRQHVMCNADETLMWSGGHLDVGVGQTRRCRDWDALREWATENSACWHDYINPRPEGETWWGKCDGGVDGLPVDSLLK